MTRQALMLASCVVLGACAPAEDGPAATTPEPATSAPAPLADPAPADEPPEEPPAPLTLRDPILFFRAPDAGLRYAYYEGERDNVRDLPDAEPVRRGETDELAIPVAGRDHFAVELSGFIEVPADGIYRFFLDSDDGSVLLIGDDLIVDNDGRHEAAERAGDVGFRAGYHQLTVRYFNATGAMHLRVSIAGPGLERQPVAAAMLFR